jgi:hypothetical protein
LLLKLPLGDDNTGVLAMKREALTFVERCRAQVEAELAKAAAGPPKRASRTGARITEYRVEVFGGAETLVEYRGERTEPFRTPRSLYDEVIRFAARQKGPFDYVSLFDALRADREHLPDYRVRVCTRFLVVAGVLRHQRRRFEPIAKGVGPCERAAKDAWDRAARTPLKPSAR